MLEGSPAERVNGAEEGPGKVREDVRTSPHAELGHVFHSCFINHCIVQCWKSLSRPDLERRRLQMREGGVKGGVAGCRSYEPIALSDTGLQSELETHFDIGAQFLIALLMRNGL